MPIGYDAKKVGVLWKYATIGDTRFNFYFHLQSFRREIDRKIELIPRVVNEAKLLRDPQDSGQPQILPGTKLISTYYRLKAVDDIKILGKFLQLYIKVCTKSIVSLCGWMYTEKELCIARHPSESVRSVLVSTLCGPSEPLSGPAQKVVHQFCDLYEHARHGAADFGEIEYQAYTCLYKKLMEA